MAKELKIDHLNLGDRNLLPVDMIGATIVDIGGANKEAKIEGGGLIIHYMAAGTTDIKQVVIAATELGMWIEG